MLRDCHVCGTSHKTTQRRFLQVRDLTFEKALQVALSTEAADTDSKRLTSSGGDKDQPAPIGKVNDHPFPNTPAWKGNRRYKSNKPQKVSQNKQQQGSDNSGKECHRCGGTHEPSICPFKQYDCHYCKKKGHIHVARMCRKKGSQHFRDSAVRREGAISTKREYNAMFHISSGKVKPLYVNVTVNGNPLSMVRYRCVSIDRQPEYVRNCQEWRVNDGTGLMPTYRSCWTKHCDATSQSAHTRGCSSIGDSPLELHQRRLSSNK